ncbi:MAG: hypothetical protein IT426_04035 [Pirellulales bacterium]|nr:hypothetical protein [Pirellulales bacterium]
MSPAKKKSASEAKYSKLSALFAGWGKYLLFGILIAGALAAAGYKIWQKVGERVLAAEEYRLTPEKIRLSPWPLPEWVKPDPRWDAFDQLQRRGPVSILDADLVERLAAAFEQNPWIAKVHRIAKEHPAAVEVEVGYRRPVLMVLVDAGGNTPYAEAYAVDAEGVSLPTKNCFTPVEIAKYPCLIGVENPPAAGVGKRWGDSRVIGGAEIAAALLPVWEKLRLKQIVPRAISAGASGTLPASTQSAQFGEYRFEIIARGTPNDKRIPWGRSPMDKNSQDFSPAQKVKKLEDLAAEFGSLDKCPREIDLSRH